MSPILRRPAAAERDRAPRSLRIPPFLADALRDGAVALEPARPGSSDGPLRVAVVITQFGRGAGGHSTVAELVRGLEARGHDVALWLVDEEARHVDTADEQLTRVFAERFGPTAAPLRRLIDPVAAGGADVAVATAWQTVPAVLRMPGVAARALLLQDHEPELYATSMEREWAAWAYRQGLHAICASPWLADVLAREYGAGVSVFSSGIDHEVFRPLPTHRREDLVLFHVRAATPRHAAALGVLALSELHHRRPGVEIALTGDARELATPFPHRHLGSLDGDALAHAYASAAVGLSLSLTSPSVVPVEMLACGLPVVGVDGEPMRATFGSDGPVRLAAPEPGAVCAAVEALLDDLVARADVARAGAELAAARTWPAAAEQVEAGLRAALRG